MPEKINGQVVVTGAAGFIGSQIANRIQPDHLILVDRLNPFKERLYNTALQSSARNIEADTVFLEKLPSLGPLSWIIHMGAITNTAETDAGALKKWNVDYTKYLWEYCSRMKIKFIYASSAATYGNGKSGFSDDPASIKRLEPLNFYGKSKHEFDLWALEQKETPPVWFGLKFFNVFGPNEGHKGAMASAVWHGYNEIKESAKMTLFRSHNPSYEDGAQSRDFIFIDDVLQILDFLISKQPPSAIYNCGTGHAQTFRDLATGLFKALETNENINWIDTPSEYRTGYQYETQAQMEKLLKAGYSRNFTSLHDGINKYLFRLGAVGI